MSKENTQKAEKYGEWLYRALAIYFLWNIYVEVGKVPGMEIRLDKHEKDIDKLQDMIYTPAWSRPEIKTREEANIIHKKKTEFLIDGTEFNIASSKNLNAKVDSFCNTN